MSDFFTEQDERMNLPDENFGEYIARMAATMNRYVCMSFGTVHVSQCLPRIRDIRVPDSTCEIHTTERAQRNYERALSTERVDLGSAAIVINNPVNEDTSR